MALGKGRVSEEGCRGPHPAGPHGAPPRSVMPSTEDAPATPPAGVTGAESGGGARRRRLTAQDAASRQCPEQVLAPPWPPRPEGRRRGLGANLFWQPPGAPGQLEFLRSINFLRVKSTTPMTEDIT